MSQELLFDDDQWKMSSPQFRMQRLQVYNWGTFSGLHDIPVAHDGHLFVGRSGSGKSTLLDALSALLVPPIWLGFNAAAREGDKGRYDRNLPSYIRGAWADQEDTGSGEIATQYLRSTTTWSALALEYANAQGQVVNLVQLFWLRGSSNRTADVKRHFMIAERSFNIASEIKTFDLDLRKLKNDLHDVFHFDKFRPYGERFRRLLGIESEMALKLLHKTQSAKNLGDLNEFLREFMLEKPPTFAVAERMVAEFAELDAAHQAVVTARKQVDLLTPARDDFDSLQLVNKQITDLDELLAGMEDYRNQRLSDLLKDAIQQLQTQEQGLAGVESQKLEQLANLKSHLNLLESQHRQQGGDQIERLEQDKAQSEQQRQYRLEKQNQAKLACKQIDWVLPDSPQAFAETISSAKEIIDNWKQESERATQKRDALRDGKKDNEVEFATVVKEISAMQRQPSNIPAHMLELRQQLTESLGLMESDLPFVGELIEVKDGEKPWQGAIERVLHGFALSILVDEDHYTAVSNHVNQARLNSRLVYFKVVPQNDVQRKSIQPESLVRKLNLKESSYKNWLLKELENRFNYACVDSMRDFRQLEKALTKEGQIRHGKSRHEKDDRRAIDDRRYWVLGFDNRDKLQLYQTQAQQLGDAISGLDQQLKKLETEQNAQQERFKAAMLLANLQWQEIDVSGLLDQIHRLEKELQYLRSGNRELQKLGEQIEKQKNKIVQTEKILRETSAKRMRIADEIKQHDKDLSHLNQLLLTYSLATEIKQQLDERFSKCDKTLTIKNLDNERNRIERGINTEKDTLGEERNRLSRSIENKFGEFIRQWPVESANMDATLASAMEFLQLLQRLEHDGLPKHEERFFTMLKEQSTENLAELNKRLSQAKKEIVERMELVNESLAEAEFNPGTHLKIEVNERYLPDVKDFRTQVAVILEHAWRLDNDEAEKRFNSLRDLVNKLGNPELEFQRWRDQVLDVRQHVEFIGREFNKQGEELEIYRSGAGKSGGQREKLATTCLAAALRYQLGGSEVEDPMYAPVVLDEAFGKADNEFTELAMRIFTNFGFQMIVATPLKSVMTLEPFIGGACFVDIKDRKHSATLQIEYDQEKKRLNLPENSHAEVVSA